MAILIKILLFILIQFSPKDLGELTYFPGIEAIRTLENIHFSQTKYIHDLLDRVKLNDTKPTLLQ